MISQMFKHRLHLREVSVFLALYLHARGESILDEGYRCLL